MGSLISSEETIFIYKPSHQILLDESIVCIEDISLIELAQPYKIIVPITKITEILQFVLKNHHSSVILIDDPPTYTLLRKIFLGIPTITLEQLCNNHKLIYELKYQQHYCPIPVILQKFHTTYISNYLNAFRFYQISVQIFSNLEEYIKSSCSSPFIICTDSELERFIKVIQVQEFKISKIIQQQHQQKFNIFCFCNKESFTLSKKMEKILEENSINVAYFHNFLEIVEKINTQKLSIHRNQSKGTENMILYLNEKDLDNQYLLKVPKKIQRHVRNLRVQKVTSKEELLKKIQNNQQSIIIISKEIKEMKSILNICDQIQANGFEDRIIFIQRESEINQKFIHRIDTICNEKSKFRKCDILSKSIIFYGSLETFQQILTTFPNIKFKLFINSKTQKQRIKEYLGIKSEIILSSIRLCECLTQYQTLIQCTVVHFRVRQDTYKNVDFMQKIEPCFRQKYVTKEQEFIDCLQNSSKETLIKINFCYEHKKSVYISKLIGDLILKLRQKKMIIKNQNDESLALLSSGGQFIENLSNLVIKYVSTKYTGNYENELFLQKIKRQVYHEVYHLSQFKTIEPDILSNILSQNSESIFQFSKFLVELLIDFKHFRQTFNYTWRSFLNQNKSEHLPYTPHIFFVVLLAFNKTNLYQYTNQSLKNVTSFYISKDLLTLDLEKINKIIQKNKKYYAYTTDLMFSSTKQDGNSIQILVDGFQFNNFHAYIPFWKKENFVILPPFTKLEIIIVDSEIKLKLQMASQQKFLQFFNKAFFSETSVQENRLLVECERQVRKFDFFLQNMKEQKHETAHYILKKILKQDKEKMQNKDVLIAYQALIYIRKKQYEAARVFLQPNIYEEFLKNVISSQKKGINEFQHSLPEEDNSSSKRIQEADKEYQFDGFSNESFEIKKDTITENSFILRNKQGEEMKRNKKGKFPSSIINNTSNRKDTIKVSKQTSMNVNNISLANVLSGESSAAEEDPPSGNDGTDCEVKIRITPPSIIVIDQFKDQNIEEEASSFQNIISSNTPTQNQCVFSPISFKEDLSHQDPKQFYSEIMPKLSKKRSSTIKQSNFLKLLLEKLPEINHNQSKIKDQASNHQNQDNYLEFQESIEQNQGENMNKIEDQTDKSKIECFEFNFDKEIVKEILMNNTQKSSSSSEESLEEVMDALEFSKVHTFAQKIPHCANTSKQEIPYSKKQKINNIFSLKNKKLTKQEIQKEIRKQTALKLNLIKVDDDFKQNSSNLSGTFGPIHKEKPALSSHSTVRQDQKKFTFGLDVENSLSTGERNKNNHSSRQFKQKDGKRLKQKDGKQLFYNFEQEMIDIDDLDSIESVEIDEEVKIHPMKVIGQFHDKKFL